MIEKVEINNIKFMTGLEMSQDGMTITIAAGTFDGQQLDEVSLTLTSDENNPLIHDLYIVKNGEHYEYAYIITHLAPNNLAFYEGEGQLMHTLLSVTVQPDGSYDGKFVYVNELKEEPRKNDDVIYDDIIVVK